MINRHHVKEISDFVGSFLEIFDSFLTAYGRDTSPDESTDITPGSFVFSVSGPIHGYLFATSRQDPKPGKRRTLFLPDAAIELLRWYSRKAQNSPELSAFRITVMDAGCKDDLLYVTRKTEPQMTVRIQAKGCTIELHAFTNSDTSDFEQVLHIGRKV
jgi:hypothetical protein